jgi:hypothetical protein
MPLADGTKFAGYTILRLLGSGGMGEVYLAKHPRLPRHDALKVLPEDVSADPDYRERFLREGDLAAALWHPNIVGVHDRGEYEGQLWIAMDFVDGTDAAGASLLVARLVLERDPQPHPEAGDLPILDHDVLPHHLGHAQVTNGVGRSLDGASSRRLPRLVAYTDHLGHSVHTLRHGCLLCSAVSALRGVRKDARAFTPGIATR